MSSKESLSDLTFDDEADSDIDSVDSGEHNLVIASCEESSLSSEDDRKKKGDQGVVVSVSDQPRIIRLDRDDDEVNEVSQMLPRIIRLNRDDNESSEEAKEGCDLVNESRDNILSPILSPDESCDDEVKQSDNSRPVPNRKESKTIRDFCDKPVASVRGSSPLQGNRGDVTKHHSARHNHDSSLAESCSVRYNRDVALDIDSSKVSRSLKTNYADRLNDSPKMISSRLRYRDDGIRSPKEAQTAAAAAEKVRDDDRHIRQMTTTHRHRHDVSADSPREPRSKRDKGHHTSSKERLVSRRGGQDGVSSPNIPMSRHKESHTMQQSHEDLQSRETYPSRSYRNNDSTRTGPDRRRQSPADIPDYRPSHVDFVGAMQRSHDKPPRGFSPPFMTQNRVIPVDYVNEQMLYALQWKRDIATEFPLTSFYGYGSSYDYGRQVNVHGSHLIFPTESVPVTLYQGSGMLPLREQNNVCIGHLGGSGDAVLKQPETLHQTRTNDVQLLSRNWYAPSCLLPPKSVGTTSVGQSSTGNQPSTMPSISTTVSDSIKRGQASVKVTTGNVVVAKTTLSTSVPVGRNVATGVIPVKLLSAAERSVSATVTTNTVNEVTVSQMPQLKPEQQPSNPMLLAVRHTDEAKLTGPVVGSSGSGATHVMPAQSQSVRVTKTSVPDGTVASVQPARSRIRLIRNFSAASSAGVDNTAAVVTNSVIEQISATVTSSLTAAPSVVLPATEAVSSGCENSALPGYKTVLPAAESVSSQSETSSLPSCKTSSPCTGTTAVLVNRVCDEPPRTSAVSQHDIVSSSSTEHSSLTLTLPTKTPDDLLSDLDNPTVSPTGPTGSGLTCDKDNTCSQLEQTGSSADDVQPMETVRMDESEAFVAASQRNTVESATAVVECSEVRVTDRYVHRVRARRTVSSVKDEQMLLSSTEEVLPGVSTDGVSELKDTVSTEVPDSALQVPCQTAPTSAVPVSTATSSVAHTDSETAVADVLSGSLNTTDTDHQPVTPEVDDSPLQSSLSSPETTPTTPTSPFAVFPARPGRIPGICEGVTAQNAEQSPLKNRLHSPLLVLPHEVFKKTDHIPGICDPTSDGTLSLESSERQEGILQAVELATPPVTIKSLVAAAGGDVYSPSSSVPSPLSDVEPLTDSSTGQHPPVSTQSISLQQPSSAERLLDTLSSFKHLPFSRPAETVPSHSAPAAAASVANKPQVRKPLTAVDVATGLLQATLLRSGTGVIHSSDGPTAGNVCRLPNAVGLAPGVSVVSTVLHNLVSASNAAMATISRPACVVSLTSPIPRPVSHIGTTAARTSTGIQRSSVPRPCQPSVLAAVPPVLLPILGSLMASRPPVPPVLPPQAVEGLKQLLGTAVRAQNSVSSSQIVSKPVTKPLPAAPARAHRSHGSRRVSATTTSTTTVATATAAAVMSSSSVCIPLKTLPSLSGAVVKHKTEIDFDIDDVASPLSDEIMSFSPPSSPKDLPKTYQPPAAQSTVQPPTTSSKAATMVASSSLRDPRTTGDRKNDPRVDERKKMSVKQTRKPSTKYTTSLPQKPSTSRGVIVKELPKLTPEQKAAMLRRVAQEFKQIMQPYYKDNRISKDEYKDIMRKAVPRICHSKTGDTSIVRMARYADAYVHKVIMMRKYLAKKNKQMTTTT
jgi:hypothetical protein